MQKSIRDVRILAQFHFKRMGARAEEATLQFLICRPFQWQSTH